MSDKISLSNLIDNRAVSDNTYFTQTGIGIGKIPKGKHFTEDQIKNFFQDRYHITTSKTFNEIWEALKAHRMWKNHSDLNIGKLREIDELIKDTLVLQGHGILPPKEPNPNTPYEIQQIVKALLHGGNISKKALKPALLKAVFVKKDQALLSQLRDEFAYELKHLANNPPSSRREKLVWDTFKGNILALLPFTYPDAGTKVDIPVRIGSEIKMVPYSVDVIHLHSIKYASPMQALALTPLKGFEGDPILSFIGTTFPAGDGFVTTVLADFTPGFSVGEAVFRKNQQALDKWFKGKENVEVYGMSLGGAMALHTYRHYSEKLSQVSAYNPPGFSWKYWKGATPSNCPVNIYTQPGDIVTKLGFWPTTSNVSLYNVFSHQEGMKKNPLANHARVYTGCRNLTILKENPKDINRSAFRRWLTWAHKFLGPLLIYKPIFIYLFLKYHIRRSMSRSNVSQK